MKRALAIAAAALIATSALAACDDVPDGPCQAGYVFDEHDKECDPDPDHGYLMPYPLILWGSGSSAYYAPRQGQQLYQVRPGYTAPKDAPRPYKAAAPKPPSSSSFGSSSKGSSSSYKGSSSGSFKAPAPAPRPVIRVR